MKITKAIRTRIAAINEMAAILDAKGVEPTVDFGTTVDYTLYDVSISLSPTDRVATVKYGCEKDIVRNIEELTYLMKYLTRGLKHGIKYGY